MDIAAYVLLGLGGVLLAFAGLHGFENKSVTIISFGAGTILIVLSACFYWQDVVWKKDATFKPSLGKEALAPKSRAYIHVEPGPIKDFAIGSRAGVSVKITNVGTAPAYDVKSDVSVGILPYPFPADYPFPGIAQKHEGSATLYPGTEGVGFGQFDTPLTKELIEAVLDGTKLRLYVGGTISYRHDSGLTCTKRFLMSVGGPEFVAAGKAYLEKGASNLVWHYADQYNDVNKECE